MNPMSLLDKMIKRVTRDLEREREDLNSLTPEELIVVQATEELLRQSRPDEH